MVRSTAFYSILDEEWPAVRDIIELRIAAATSPSAPDPAINKECLRHGGSGTGQLMITA